MKQDRQEMHGDSQAGHIFTMTHLEVREAIAAWLPLTDRPTADEIVRIRALSIKRAALVDLNNADGFVEVIW